MKKLENFSTTQILCQIKTSKLIFMITTSDTFLTLNLISHKICMEVKFFYFHIAVEKVMLANVKIVFFDVIWV